MNIILKNARIVTQNGNRDVLSGDIWVAGDTIRQLGPDISAPGVRELDLNGQAVIPGLIQSHVHLCQTVFRNMADDLELLEWLTRYIWPMEMAHTPETLLASARLGLCEMLTSGVTSILDMGCMHHMDTVFEEIARCGIRAFSGKVMMDAGEQPYQEPTAASIRSTEALIDRWHGAENGRIQYALAPRFVLTCSPALWEGVRELSRRHDLLIHTHSSENRSEIELVEAQTGYRNINFFVAHQLASDKLCLAHCVWLDEEELSHLQNFKINVLHCPGANLKLGSGYAPIPRIRDRGINISLGSDGAPCNNNMDIFMDMRLAALMHKPNHGVASITAQDVFDMATLGGARALGKGDQIGSIETGKKADLTILNLDKVHASPADNMVSQIVYSARSEDVRHVMVDGEWVVRDGVARAYPDEMEVVSAARSACKQLMNIIN